jgi:ankyrin repeat protein
MMDEISLIFYVYIHTPGTPYIAADLEAVNDAGETPLMAACGAGCNSAVRMLIEIKADMTVQKVTNSFTPLHMACQVKIDLI